MVNRLGRSPGTLRGVESRAQFSAVPSAVVEQGDAERALANLGGSLGARLKRMADGAAAREGEAAGQSAGAKAGEKYVAQYTAEAKGTPKPPAAAKPPGKPAAAGGGAPGGPSGLDTTPLQLRNDGTIRGEAFDRAAMQSYGWRMQTGLSVELAEAFEANKDSPGGYETAVSKIAGKYQEDPLLKDGPMGEVFQKLLIEKTSISRIAVRANHEQKVAGEQRQAAVEGVDAMLADLERDAFNAGGNAEAAALLEGNTKRALAMIDNGQAANSFTAAEAGKLRKAVTSTVFAAQTEGTFANIAGAGARQEFALSIMEGYSSGEGPFASLTLDEAQNLSGELYRRATADVTAETAAEKADAGKLVAYIAEDVASMASTGQGLDQSMSGLSSDRVADLLGQDAAREWQEARDVAAKTWAATSGMEAETPAELNDRLEALKPKPGAAGFTEQAEIHAAAVKRASEVLTARTADPLFQAHGAGIIQLQPIDTSSPEALAQSLKLRKQQAEVVASQYGIPATVFRPDERASLNTALLDNPSVLPGFAKALTEQLGPLAPKALAELSEQGPEIAHAAGVGIATGSNSIAADIGIVLAGRRDGKFNAKLPAEGTLNNAINAQVAGAFQGNDDARSAVAGVAAMLFEKEANQLGFDPAEIDDPGSAAAASLKRSVDRALGGRQIGEEHWGGLGIINGQATVLPSFMPSSRPAELLQRLNDKVVEALPEIGSVNGVPVGADQIRNAHLVAIGDGTYRVAIGDPSSLDPQYIATPDGDYWVLDFEQLEKATAAQPAPAGLQTGWTMMFGTR